MAVLGWEIHKEIKSVEIANSKSGGIQKWDYDGGWARGLAMFLSAGIIVVQVHAKLKTSNIARK